MSTDPRLLHWDACLNARDLGGFPTRDGRTTRAHAVIRADNLCRLTRHGRQALCNGEIWRWLCKPDGKLLRRHTRHRAG